MENACDLFVLSDEYQVARVKKECHKFLMSAKYDDKIAVKVLSLAEKYGLTDLETNCRKHLSSLEFDKLNLLKGFWDLDEKSIRYLLIQQIKRANNSRNMLKKCLRDVLPQLVGLLEFTIHLLVSTQYKKERFQRCPFHYDSDGKARSDIYKRAKSCPECQVMLKRIPVLGRTEHSYYFRNPEQGRHYYSYGYDLHFDENIVELLPRLMDILRN